MAETYPHLQIQREEPITEKRPGGRPQFFVPNNPAEHGKQLREGWRQAKQKVDQEVGGFDDRKLFRFSVQKGFDPDSLKNISRDIEFVSQEGEEIFVAFVSEVAFESFEARLSSLSQGEDVQYINILYALKGFDGWLPEDRMGWALKEYGLPVYSC